MMSDLSKRAAALLRYASALASTLSVFIASASIAFLFPSVDHPLINQISSETIAVLLGMGATLLAAVSAGYMWVVLRKEALRKKLRQVFVIYAKPDLDAAKTISQFLRDEGLDPWLDIDKIEAGQVWRDTISNALSDSALAIVLVSKSLLNSEFALSELKQAIAKLESRDKLTSPLIPVKLDDTPLPSSISHIQAVDMRADDSLPYLSKSLRGAMGRILGSKTGN